MFSSWTSLVDFCKTLNAVVDTTKGECVIVMKLDGVPPWPAFSILIDKHFHVQAFRYNSPICIKDLLHSFGHCLERKSQLIAIIKRLESSDVNLNSEMHMYGELVFKDCREANVPFDELMSLSMN